MIGNESYLSMIVALQAGISGDVGTVYVGVRRSLIDADRSDAQRQVLTAAGIALGVGAVLALGFGLLLTRPVSALASAARRIQNNDLHSPVPRSGPREMRELAGALDEMRLSILETREDLIGHNMELALRADASDAGLSQATVELSVMHNIIEELTHAPADAPDTAAVQLLRLDWIDGASIALRGADGQFRLAADRSFAPGVADAILRALNGGLTEPTLAAGVFVGDSRGSLTFAPLAQHDVAAIAIVPMATSAGIMGALAVTATHPLAYPESQRSLLRAAANDLGASIERFALATEVEESRRLAESVLREMTDGLIVLDSDGRCQVCNNAAARMLGVHAPDVLDRPAADWLPFPAATIERVLHPIESRSADGQPEPPQAAVVAEHDGRLLALSSSPLHGADAAQSGAIFHVRDVTEIFAAERLKQDFVLMIGHDLRTPLTLIRASIDLLTEQGAGTLTATQQRITEVLRNNSERLLHLISDLLDMSALDSGTIHAYPDHASLSQLADETVEAHRADAAKHGLTLSAQHPAEPVFGWVDANRIRQVLSNLVENALKYTPSDGRVTVRVTPGDPFVRIDVVDTGIGIPPIEQHLLFTRFYRTTAGRTHTGGTGLGLAIAASIVELHGGKIWCESDGTSGSTFSFTLPCRPPADGAQPERAAGSVSRGGR